MGDAFEGRVLRRRPPGRSGEAGPVRLCGSPTKPLIR